MLHKTCKTPSDQQEQLWLRQVQNGDTDAFEALFYRYADGVYRLAITLLGDEAEAEETTQEVFLILYEKAATYRAEAKLSTWLYRITANTALNRLKRQRRWWKICLDEVLPAFDYRGKRRQPIIDPSPDLEDEAIRQEARQLLRQCMEELRPLDKAVLTLTDLEEVSNQEASGILGLSLSAVKSRRRRARLLLRRRLEAFDAVSSLARTGRDPIGIAG